MSASGIGHIVDGERVVAVSHFAKVAQLAVVAGGSGEAWVIGIGIGYAADGNAYANRDA